MAFEIKESTDKGIVIAELRGELDSSSVAAFTLGFKEISDKHGKAKYILDLKALDFISSAGWTAFLNEFRRLGALGAEIKLASMQPDAKRVYSLVGIDGVIKSYETVKEAADSYGKNG
ncbi:MAG TPA: STAS domain-containing protein [Candidatus Goldiibacteriota bacterium]|nr:STAS domain-containing protein [Candidatus Goldiibacteriota bacterium]HRQ43527.1 STAS domain-containing protein [Candidatus Goldiibacteriota bacterium]